MAGSYSYLADVINHHADLYLQNKLEDKHEAERRQHMLEDEARHEATNIRAEDRHNTRDDSLHVRDRQEILADETRRMGQATKQMLNSHGLNPDMNDPTAVAAAIARLGPDEQEKLKLVHEIGVGVTQGNQVDGDYTKMDLGQLRDTVTKQRAAIGAVKTANTAAWQKVEAGVQAELDHANEMSANPTLDPDELLEIRKNVAYGLGAKSISGADLNQKQKLEYEKQVLELSSQAKQIKGYQARKDAAGLTQQLKYLIDTSKVPPLAPGTSGSVGNAPRMATPAQLDAASKAFVPGGSPGAVATPAAVATSDAIAGPTSGSFNSTIAGPSAYLTPQDMPTPVPAAAPVVQRAPGGLIGAGRWLGQTAMNAPASVDNSIDWAGRKASALGSYLLGGQSYLDADRAKRAAVSAAFPAAVQQARANMAQDPGSYLVY